MIKEDISRLKNNRIKCSYADKYKAIKKPTCGCEVCMLKWEIAELKRAILNIDLGSEEKEKNRHDNLREMYLRDQHETEAACCTLKNLDKNKYKDFMEEMGIKDV